MFEDQDPTEVDLRHDDPESNHPATVSSAPDGGQAASFADTTLASVAHRLFATIETQLARDPSAPAVTALATRVDGLERSIRDLAAQLDRLGNVYDRLEQISAQLEAPDPHAAFLTSLNERLNAVEHRLGQPPLANDRSE